MGCGASNDAQQAEGIASFFGKVVTIKTCHGNFLRAHAGEAGAVLDQQTEAHEWEQWTIEDAGEGKVFFKSHHGTWIRANAPTDEEATVDMSGAAHEWEQFEAVAEGDQWRFKSHHGTFLRANEGGEGATVDQKKDVDTLGDWENFTVAVVEA